MSNFSTKQRQQAQRQQSNNLLLSLFGSILIHGFVALALSRHQSPQSLQIEKPIEIVIVEQPQTRSPKIASTRQPKPESKPAVSSIPPTPTPSNPVKTTPTPPPKAQPPSVKTQPIPAPKPVTPPPKVEHSQPKIEPPPPQVPTPPASQKSDSPPVATSTETPVEGTPPCNDGTCLDFVKSPKNKPQPNINRDIERLIDGNETEQSENSELATAPRTNSDRHNEKPIIPPIDKPVKPETSKQETNSASTLNLNSDRQENRSESTQPESSEIADNSSTQPNSENSSTERQSEGENNNSTTEDNNSTAANTISDEPEKPLSISCEKNCQPEYPSALDGVEGSAGIQLIIDADGNVIDAAIAVPNGNPKLDREALKAARRMEFSSIDRDRATVRINISFTVAGSDFERQARREQEERERQEKERLEIINN